MAKSLVESAMEATLKWAMKSFKKQRNRKELVADAVSTAWEMAMATDHPHATPSSIARFAVRRVKGGRQFRQSKLSIDSKRCPLSTRLVTVEWDEIGRETDDPAKLATLRIDMTAFLENLSDRHREILLAMINGESNSELSAKFGVSKGRISQLRRGFVDDFELFCS